MSEYSRIARDAVRASTRCLRCFTLILAFSLIRVSAAEEETTVAALTNKTDLTQVPLETLMQMDVPKVSGASKFEQKATEAPASVSVVSQDEIKRYGYQTLADVLQSLQGFNVTYDRNYSFLGSRGVSLGDFNSRILLLVDGHRINNDLNDGAFIGNEFILDMDLVDRVEVIRGPGSVLYGNNAFFGVVNVITRRAAQLNGFEVSGEYGSFDSFKGRISWGRAFTNGPEVLLSGTFYGSSGPGELYYKEYDTPAQNHGVAQGLDGESYGSAFGSVIYRDFSLEAGFIDRKKDNPTAQYFTTFNDPRLKTADERDYASLKYAHEFEDIVDVTALLYYDRCTFDIGYPLGPAGNTAFFKESQSGEWWGTELQLSKKLWDKHVFTAGAEYRNDFSQNDRVYDGETGATVSETHHSRETYGFYGEGDIAVLSNLHVNAGVRYDQSGDFDPSVNPRVALIYNPFEKSTFKAIYGTAFRAPNFLELSDPRFQNISPEEITSYELIYEQGIGSNLRSSVASFYNDMDHLIAFQSGNFTNLDARAMGLEFALEGLWASGVRTRASYTLQTVENRSGPESMPDSPEQLVKLNVSVPVVKDKLFASLEVQYTSSRRTFFTTSTGETLPGLDAPGYGVVNFTLFSQNLLKNLEASASIYNLFDQHYTDPATRFHLQDQILQNGRTFRLKLTYHF